MYTDKQSSKDFDRIGYQHMEKGLERENIKQRQKEGIASAKNKGIKFGRPKLEINSENFESIYKQWKSGKIKGVEAMKMTKATFYRRVEEHENR